MKGPIHTLTIAAALAILIGGITASPPVPEAQADQQPAPRERIASTTIEAAVTSYSSDPAQTDDTPDITASGTHVHDGTLACPTRYAFGTKVLIEGKEYVCEDRMSRKYPDRFDVWSPSKEAATAWGLQTLTITIEQ